MEDDHDVLQSNLARMDGIVFSCNLESRSNGLQHAFMDTRYKLIPLLLFLPQLMM